MYSMNGVKYNNYIVKSFNTDRTLVESYKSEILRKEKICLFR